MTRSVPVSEEELLTRANDIAGLSLMEIAHRYQVVFPQTLAKAKGFVGQLIEFALGADAGSLPIPDFYHLGIELKTIPINQRGKPMESTYVCMTRLIQSSHIDWLHSEVKAKLTRVLWVPIEADKHIPLAERRVGSPILWSPTIQEENSLRQDWEDLMDMVSLGQLEKISAKLGTYLQIRPKAANAKALCWGINEVGDKILTLPRGFYLRASFTEQILKKHFL